MKLDVRKSSAAFAAVAVGGVSTLAFGVAPASAAPGEPCLDGALVAPGVCELVITGGTSTFTPAASMTQLEVLLVGAGGNGADQVAPNTAGYAAAGGGGEVVYVDFSGATDPIDIVVGTPGGDDSSADDGTTSGTARNGEDATTSIENNVGGDSGNENSGYSGTLAGGGGAGGSTPNANGGAGVVVNTLVDPGSLFADDTSCFGGGGAAGSATVFGVAGCGAGGPADNTNTTLFAPLANSGGGGGGLTVTQSPELRRGADGVAIVRWTAAPVLLSFDVLGKGTAPAAQAVIPGTAPTAPANPTASGFEFTGWYVDAALTIPADFSQPIVESTTYYAAWAKALAATGSTADASAVMPIALGALIAGAGLFAVASRRRRTN